MTNQTGERLARSACPKCGSGVAHSAGVAYYTSREIICYRCHYLCTPDEAYQHGLELEREQNAE